MDSSAAVPVARNAIVLYYLSTAQLGVAVLQLSHSKEMGLRCTPNCQA